MISHTGPGACLRGKLAPVHLLLFPALTLTLQTAKEHPLSELFPINSSHSTLFICSSLSNNLKYDFCEFCLNIFPHSHQFGSECPFSKAGKWQKHRIRNIASFGASFVLWGGLGVGLGWRGEKKISSHFRILGFSK